MFNNLLKESVTKNTCVVLERKRDGYVMAVHVSGLTANTFFIMEGEDLFEISDWQEYTSESGNQQTAIEAAILAGGGELLSTWSGWTTSSYIDCRYNGWMFEIRLSDHGVGLTRGLNSRTLFLFDSNSVDEMTSKINTYLKGIADALNPERDAKAEFEARVLTIKINKNGKPLHHGRIIKWQKALRLASK